MKAKKDQFQRFLKAARELGADDTGAEFERAFAKIVPPREKKAETKKANRPRRRSRPA